MSQTTEQGEKATYQLMVKGQLDESWSDWLGGMSVEPQASGETLLSGCIRGQAALHGLLNKIRDLGLPLVCVNRCTCPPVRRGRAGRQR